MNNRPLFVRWTCLSFFLTILPCLSACSTFKIESPPGDHRVVLGAFRSDCRPGVEKKQWGLLFGVLPLNHPDFSEALRDPNKTYRIKEGYDWKDVLIDIVGGALLSLNRRTITAEECNEAFVVRTPRQIEEEQQQILQASLDLYLSEHAPASEDGAVIILASGETKVGRIQEVNAKEIVLAVKKKVVAPKPVDRIVLRGGGALLGDIVRQSRDSVTLRTDKGVQEIEKKRILLILFHRTEPKTEEGKSGEEAAEKKEEFFFESVHIHRADIRRIVLRRDVDEAVKAQQDTSDKEEGSSTPGEKKIQKNQ